LGDGFIDDKLGGVFSCRGGKEAERALLTGREDAGFHGADAFEPPAVFGNGLGDIDFEGADGGESFADAFAVRVEGGLLGGSKKVDLTGV
jgi:hypothetical protein